MVYLDHHAATPLSEAARIAMERAGPSCFANPASTHAAGRAARALLEQARASVADAMSAAASDLVFTSGGSEACNLGVLGAPELAGAHLVTTAVEHPAVARAVDWLEARAGVEVTRLRVPAGAPPTPEQLADALRPETRLVAVQWVNHETGTLFPIAEYGRVCRAAGVTLFVDATQALGKLPVKVSASGADLIAIASHKIGGPSGAGALWVRRGVQLAPLVLGGAQERGRRAGSPPLACLVGFGGACALLRERIAAQPRIEALRTRLEAALVELGAIVNAERGLRVSTVVNVSVRGWSGAELVAALDLEGVCVSAGAACSSGLVQASPVLRAMYPDAAWRADSAVRFSFGVETMENDIEFALSMIRRVFARGAERRS